MLYDNMVLAGNRIFAHSYAKINLTLDVLGKMENGYHEVNMVMQTVQLFDLIIIDKTRHGISVSSNLRYLPNNHKNIAYQAAALFLRESGKRGGVKIKIHKNIPVSAGLAGGSGNAAAVLCAMNMLFDQPFSLEKLCVLGAQLGADVPYCLTGGTQLACGIGEKLTPLSPIPPCYVLLVKPPINVSTASIYAQIDAAPVTIRPDTEKMISALDKRDYRTICSSLCNVMENVTENMHPVIRGIKQKMLADGADGALMSGSGPTVFGLFSDLRTAKACADKFSIQFQDVYLTKTQTV